MKKVFKIMSLVLALMLAIGVLAGCGGSKTARETGSYTYWASLGSQTAQTQEKYDDMLMYQELEKRTGIHVDFIHPSKGSTGTEAFQILLTSSDMPDMIEYSCGDDKAIEDKVIISLNKYLEEAAPNYYSYMEGEKAAENGYIYKAQSITNNGNYYGFKNMCIGQYRCFGGLYVRKDMLDKWGLDIPVTIDDWTELFKTAKENGVKKPLTGSSDLFSLIGNQVFNVAWNVAKGYYIDGDKVKYGPFESAYKDYVAQMAAWYKDGYIDVDYLTNDSSVIQGNMTNDSSVAAFGFVGSSLGVLLPAMEAKNPEYNLAACPRPVLKEGDISTISNVSPESLEPTIAITYACGKDNEERYKEAMKWCDYLYSDEGIILKSFGVEGGTYYTEQNPDGSTKYKYIISDPAEMEKIGAHSVEAALYHYFRPANSPGFNQHDDYLDGFYPYQQQKDALQTWNLNIDEAKKHALPTLSYTEEEATQTAEINAKCREKLDAAINDIIRNEISIDSYDAVIKEAKSGGMDKVLEIYQTAYGRYLKNLK